MINQDNNFQEETVVVDETSILKNLKSSSASLVEIYGDKLGQKFELDSDEVLIGRDVKSDIIIDSVSVSRKHAMIYKNYYNPDNSEYFSSFWVKDLGSTNGTYVRDKQITNEKLKNGDTVKIGSTIYKFILGSNIENAYFEEIYQMTIIDGLTNSYNKRYFLENLDKEISRSKRYGRPLSLIMFDIDFFKKINDSYGHLAGDFILKKLSTVVKTSIRMEEIFARYGGEEFVITLPESTKDASLKLAEKIRHLVEVTCFNFKERNINLTISIGVAAIDKKITSAMSLIAEADKNLYIAKNNGRNSVV
jgi:two-component system, cell cycle response regulator